MIVTLDFIWSPSTRQSLSNLVIYLFSLGGEKNYVGTETCGPNTQEVYAHARMDRCAPALSLSIVDRIISLNPSKGGYYLWLSQTRFCPCVRQRFFFGGEGINLPAFVHPFFGNIQLPRPGVLSLVYMRSQHMMNFLYLSSINLGTFGTMIGYTWWTVLCTLFPCKYDILFP